MPGVCFITAGPITKLCAWGEVLDIEDGQPCCFLIFCVGFNPRTTAVIMPVKQPSKRPPSAASVLSEASDRDDPDSLAARLDRIVHVCAGLADAPSAAPLRSPCPQIALRVACIVRSSSCRIRLCAVRALAMAVRSRGQRERSAQLSCKEATRVETIVAKACWHPLHASASMRTRSRIQERKYAQLRTCMHTDAGSPCKHTVDVRRRFGMPAHADMLCMRTTPLCSHINAHRE
jgi:hypothetical protein